MRQKLLLGNWKMNLSVSALSHYVSEWSVSLGDTSSSSNGLAFGFAVPYLFLQKSLELFKPHSALVGVQNVHWQPNGAYTGEISLPMLKESGAQFTLVGHSERRQYYAETNDTVAKKVEACLQENFLTVLCVGETQTERAEKRTFQVVEEQLKFLQTPDVRSLVEKNTNSLVVAYEPVWAIGTGLSATAKQAQEVHAYIRKKLSIWLGSSISDRTKILYGGSMNAENITELLREPDIDGGLVGGASLKPKDFAKMCGALS